MKNCILTGVGGQGTILAAKLIAQAAIDKGLQVRTAETIGMAQRGGSVLSHVRFGQEIHSPMVPLSSADLIIGFEIAEAVRALPYLKQNGMVIVSKKAIVPFTTSLSGADYNSDEMLAYLKNRAARLYMVDTDFIANQCGTGKVVNVALLGAVAALGALDFSLDDMERSLHHVLPEKLRAVNIKALHLGAESVTKNHSVIDTK